MMARLLLVLAMSTVALACRAEPRMYLDSFVVSEWHYISLTGLWPCFSRGRSDLMMAFVDSRDRQFQEIGCWEYTGDKIKVYLLREDLEFDAGEEQYEFRESQCPDCEVAEPEELAPV